MATGVEEAVMEAAAAGLAYLESQAGFVRTGRHGATSHTGQWHEAKGFTVARFPQRTSRDLDPQLHVHQAVLNRVEGPDGQWLALDGRALHTARPAAAAISERVLESGLTDRFGIVWETREDGVGQRIVAIESDIEDLFSSRRQAITAATEKHLAAFEVAVGRPANKLERVRQAQRVTLTTRRGKTKQGESSAEQHQRWAAEASAEFAGGLARQGDALRQVPGVQRFLDGQPAAEQPAVVEEFSPRTVIATALEACHGPDGKSTFTRHDLIRQISLALPPNLGASGDQAGALLERLADRAIAELEVVQVAGHVIGTPDQLRANDDASVSIDPSAIRYATRGHLAAEFAALRLAGTRGRHCLDLSELDIWLDRTELGAALSPAQRAALVGVATSDAALVVLVGPAGTGKSYTAGVLDQAWRRHTHTGRVVGVAITQAAADVLADDGVATSANVAAFLAAQNRIAAGRAQVYDESWRLTDRDLVLVDEASMLDTGSLTRLHEATEAAGARLVLMGDPAQLSAVGASGMMRAAVERDAETYTLTEVRRFTHAWEATASLAIREGDPDAVGEYDRHGRILDAGTEQSAVRDIARAAAADMLDGKEVVVVTATNDQAAAVNAAIRRHLVDAGRVAEEAGVLLGRDGTHAGVGDVVQARRIDHDLGLVNRENYTIRGITESGDLEVTPVRTGRPALMPAAYVAEDVTLAYASTAHGAQGRTVDVGHVLLSGHLDREGAYVGLSRGRESNTVWAVTHAPGFDPDQPQPTARGMLARALTARSDPIAQPAEAATVDVAAADEELRSHAGTLLDLIETETRIACRARLERQLDGLVADGLLTDDQRARLGAEQGTEHLSRLLRIREQAGDDPAEVLHAAINGRRDLGDARAISQVLAARIQNNQALTDPTQDAGVPRNIRVVEAERLSELGRLLDDRRTQLGEQLAAAPTDWVTNALGAPSEQPEARADWIQAAGTVAAHREATGWDHTEQPLGRCPGVHTPEKRASWHAAYGAAGQPEERRPEAEMPDGCLHVRVRAAERARAAEPPAVYEQQRAAHQAAERARRDAALAGVRGDQEKADQLAREADDHAAAAKRLDEATDTRVEYRLYSAETYAAGDAARDELLARGITPGQEPDRTTVAEWLYADREATAEEDRHRPVTETDLAEEKPERQPLEVVEDQESQDAAPASDDGHHDSAPPVVEPQRPAVSEDDASTVEADRRTPSAASFEAEIAAARAKATRDALDARRAQDDTALAEDDYDEQRRRTRLAERVEAHSDDKASDAPVLELDHE
ncbi:MAG: MobF family relaxase [Nocardioides sp.]